MAVNRAKKEKEIKMVEAVVTTEQKNFSQKAIPRAATDCIQQLKIIVSYNYFL